MVHRLAGVSSGQAVRQALKWFRTSACASDCCCPFTALDSSSTDTDDASLRATGLSVVTSCVGDAAAVDLAVSRRRKVELDAVDGFAPGGGVLTNPVVSPCGRTGELSVPNNTAVAYSSLEACIARG